MNSWCFANVHLFPNKKQKIKNSVHLGVNLGGGNVFQLSLHRFIINKPRLYLQVFQFHGQPCVCEVRNFLIFSFQSFITPTLIYILSLTFALMIHNKHSFDSQSTTQFFFAKVAHDVCHVQSFTDLLCIIVSSVTFFP